MSTNFWLVVGIVGAGILAWAISTIRTYFRYRGQMLFTCREKHKPAAVHIAAGKAALTSLTPHPTVRLHDCSSWPERRDCGQECLSELGANPENCLVWTKVTDWYRGRSCAYCHKPFNALHWHDHRPALIGRDHKTRQWTDLSPEKLPEVFSTHLPVCWSCHITEMFRREHPELVTNRPLAPLARRM